METMATTHQPDFVRHFYTINHNTQSYEIYQLNSTSKNYSLLTALCRIEKFFGKSNASNIEKYFRLRTTNSWNTSEKVTGLREHTRGIYHGNRVIDGKKSLLIFFISEDKTALIVDYYRSYYPHTPTVLKTILTAKEKEYKQIFL
jgi:hypothetical protein